MTWNSPSSVMGSLYFLRRKCSFSRMSRFGGKVLAYLRWNSMMARAYCWPRKISSASFSRCIAVFHAGNAIVRKTAMIAIPTSSAAIAKPAFFSRIADYGVTVTTVTATVLLPFPSDCVAFTV